MKRRPWSETVRWSVALALLLMPALAQAEPGLPALVIEDTAAGGKQYSISLQVLMFMTVLSLLPALLLTMT